MRRCLPTALLMLTTACGLAAADDPLAQPVPAAKRRPVPHRPTTKSAATPPTVTVDAINAKKADAATTAKSADPGYTQIGTFIKLKLDRQKTHLNLYENTTYIITAERQDVAANLEGSVPRLLKIEDIDGGYITFHTLEPGITSLNYFDNAEKPYTIEITILGDTRPLQAQLAKLYPQASLQATKVGESVLLRGTVAKSEQVAEIVEIAEQFYPKVLNQLKLAEATVHDTRLAQPRPPRSIVPQYRQVDGQWRRVYGVPQPHPVRVPASPPKPAESLITIQALVLEIDWKRLAESKLDLARTIRAFASDPKSRDLSDPPTKQSLFLATAVPTNTTDGIVRLLTHTKAVKVISKPHIRTLAGQPAEIALAQEIPTIAWGENDKPRVVIQNHPIGTTLKLTPWLVSNGGIKLAVAIEHSQRLGSTAAGVPGGLTVPNIRAYKLDLMVELNAGHSIILTETGPPSGIEKNQAVGKGLMVVISPSIIAATPTTQRTLAKPGATDLDGVRFNSLQQVAPPATQPVQPATFDALPPKRQDLHQSVRELRGEVRALRRDVGRLLKLLEKNEKKQNELRQSNISPDQRDDIMEALARAAGVKENAWKELRQPKAASAEQKILKALEKKVSLDIDEVSLADVIRDLGHNYDFNIVLDSQGLKEEGFTGKTPVTTHVDGVMLKSALKLMLEPFHLAYQIRDDVLVITSRQRAQGGLVTMNYAVADLVVPLPSFLPVATNQKGGLSPKVGVAPASPRYKVHQRLPDSSQRESRTVDFDTLVKLITSTIQPDSWDKVGGRGSIRPFGTTLSLVIRQTQQVHEEIADLLEQLRRLQDMQVTVQAVFLTKPPERLWEKVGIDFDKKAAESAGCVVLEDRHAKALLKAFQGGERSNIIRTASVTMFNGQAAEIPSYSVGGRPQKLRHSLFLQPVISADQRAVRLNVRVSDRESPKASARSFFDVVPDGKSLLIDISRWNGLAVGVPILNKIPYIARRFKNSGVRSKNERVFLLVTPRIIIQEEEEELLGIPQE